MSVRLQLHFVIIISFVFNNISNKTQSGSLKFKTFKFESNCIVFITNDVVFFLFKLNEKIKTC